MPFKQQTTGISEAAVAPAAYESDRFPNKFIDQTGFYANEKAVTFLRITIG
jgi:hypothetical protein